MALVANNNGIFIWQINESVEELRDRALLSNEESAIFEGMTSQKRQLEWLCARVMIKELVSSSESIKYNNIGAPTISKGYVSISHSSDYVALMTASSPCGVDIELLARDFTKVAPRFLAESENVLLRNICSCQCYNITLLYGYIWCAKEAIYKMMGQTDIDFNRDIIVRNLSCNLSRGEIFFKGIRREISFFKHEKLLIAYIS